MLSQIKLIVISILLILGIISTFIISSLKDKLEVEKENVTTLQNAIEEQGKSFDKLKLSCETSMNIVERSSTESRVRVESAETIKKEIRRLESKLVPSNPKEDMEGVTDEKFSKDIYDLELPSNLIGLLDKAYCSAANNNLRCSTK